VDPLLSHINWSLERQFDDADVALYNVMEDPEEKIDLSTALPEVFQALRQVHLVERSQIKKKVPGWRMLLFESKTHFKY